MGDNAAASHDDVNDAFRSGRVWGEPDARLLEYLRVLCSEIIRNDEVRTLAVNRCLTLNTILTRRFMERVDRATTYYSRAVIGLTIAAVAAAIVQTSVVLRQNSRPPNQASPVSAASRAPWRGTAWDNPDSMSAALARGDCWPLVEDSIRWQACVAGHDTSTTKHRER